MPKAHHPCATSAACPPRLPRWPSPCWSWIELPEHLPGGRVMALSGAEASPRRSRRRARPRPPAWAPRSSIIQHDAGPGTPVRRARPDRRHRRRGRPGRRRVGDRQALSQLLLSAPTSEAQLKATGRQSVVFAGFMTHMCVQLDHARRLQPRLCAHRRGQRDGHPRRRPIRRPTSSGAAVVTASSGPGDFCRRRPRLAAAPPDA